MRTSYFLTVSTLLTALVAAGCIPSASGTDKDLVDPLFEATAGAKALALGDMNNDGLIDVVSISSESQPVQIHLRNPLTGIFDTYSIAGGAPLAQLADVELADLNGDGKLDIIVLVSDTAFVPPKDVAKVGAVVMLIQGPDPREPADWIQVPGPGVPPPSNLSLASNDTGATDMVVADFDGLNGPDIVVLSNETDARRVRLFANPGPAEAADPTAWQSTVIEQDASDLGKAALVDLDRDGDLDIVMSVPAAKSFNLRWLQNPKTQLVADNSKLTPTFVPDTIDPRFLATAGAKAAAIGDINGDGFTDIASISDESQPVQIHLHDSATGTFDTISIAGGSPLALTQDIALADFNGDGKLDIAVLVNDTGYAVPSAWEEDKIAAVVILLQGSDPRNPSDWVQVDSNAAYAANPPCALDPPGTSTCDMFMLSGTVGATDMEVADFDNDGLPDIAVICNRRDKDDNPVRKFVYLLASPGAAAADPANWHRTIIAADAVDFARLATADLDEDGNNDLVLTMPRGKSFNISWLRNTDNGTKWYREFLAQQQNGGDFITAGDIDGDGHVDVAAASLADSLVQWFYNPGPDNLAPGEAQVPWDVYNIGAVTGGNISQVQLVDLDGDGKLDCFVTAGSAGTGFRPQADVQHTWDPFLIFTADPPATIGQVAFYDFDGDGKIDFVAPFNRQGLLNDQFVLYRSLAASLWHRRLVGQQQGGANYITLGDIDGDGNVDVAAASADLMTVQWFQNPGPTRLLPTAPQVPWDVLNLGLIAGGAINQVQLVDLDGDHLLDCFLTADGTAFEFYRGADVQESWTGSAMFKTDPKGQIGPVGFLDVNGNGLPDILAPVDRDGLTQDQIVIFGR